MLLLQVLRLARADAVLARAGAAALEGVGDDLGVDRSGPLEVRRVLCVHGEDGVVVAVADVPEDGPFETVRRWRRGRGLEHRATRRSGRTRRWSSASCRGEAPLWRGRPRGGPPTAAPLRRPPRIRTLPRPRPRRVRAPPPRRARLPPPCPRTRGRARRGRGVGCALVGVHRFNGAGVDQLDTPDLHPRPDWRPQHFPPARCQGRPPAPRGRAPGWDTGARLSP